MPSFMSPDFTEFMEEEEEIDFREVSEGQPRPRIATIARGEAILGPDQNPCRRRQTRTRRPRHRGKTNAGREHGAHWRMPSSNSRRSPTRADPATSPRGGAAGA